jgi:hypothetical protein
MNDLTDLKPRLFLVALNLEQDPVDEIATTLDGKLLTLTDQWWLHHYRRTCATAHGQYKAEGCPH